MTTKRIAPTATRPHGRVDTPRLQKANAATAGTCTLKGAGDDVPHGPPLRVPVAKSRQRALVREYGIDLAPVSEAEARRRREAL